VDAIASTQAELIARAEAGSKEVALLARRQTAGRGRLGRAWVSDAGNLHLSVLWRTGAIGHPGHWSLLAGVALHDALDRPNLQLKWPNDLLLHGAKVAGVLVDAGPGWLVVGIGINLAWAPEGLGRPVTALGGASVDAVAARLLAALGHWRAVYEKQGFAPIRDAWLAAGPAGIGLRDDGALLVPGEAPMVAGELP